jgi:hypothetical protein
VILKKLLLIIFFISLTIAVFAQPQIPSNWYGDTPPQNTIQYMFAVGMSDPSVTEQEAISAARLDATLQLAFSAASRVQGQENITATSEHFASEIEDEFIVRVQTSSITTDVPLTGVRILDRRSEMQDGRYIVRVLLYMTVEDFNRAIRQVEDERRRTITLYTNRINENNRNINQLINMSAAEKYTVDGYERYRRAALIAYQSANYAAIIARLGGHTPPLVGSANRFNLEAANITRRLKVANIQFAGDTLSARERHTIISGLRNAMQTFNTNLELNENAEPGIGHGFRITVFLSQLPSGLLRGEITVAFLQGERILHQNTPYSITEQDEAWMVRRIVERLRADRAFFNRVNAIIN